jgi:predicted alpha/beta hydrolase family esterase
LAAPILILPGLFDSGPEHWQSLFEKTLPPARRVVQRDWARPDREEWVATLCREIESCDEPPVLVAHSLGCIAAAHWAAANPSGRVRGALLVAPSDVDRPDSPEAIRNFRPVPMRALPFVSVLVASSTDPFLSVERSRDLARAWRSRWIDLGPAGHVNAESGFGPWPEGLALVAELAGEERMPAES